MNFTLSDQMISEFLSGLLVVMVLVAVGSALALMLGRMSKRFPFSRLSLVLALSPLCFARMLEYAGNTTLQLYAMIVILLGISIDGIAFLLEPRARPELKEAEVKEAREADKPAPGVIIWKKAK